MKRYVCRYLLLAILLLAAALRFYRLDVQSFWNDEGNSARIAERSLDLILEGAEGDIHPPGYYLLLHYWRELCGQTEFALRAFSVGAGLALVAFSAIGPQEEADWPAQAGKDAPEERLSVQAWVERGARQMLAGRVRARHAGDAAEAGLAAYRKGDAQAAREACERAISLNPGLVWMPTSRWGLLRRTRGYWNGRRRGSVRRFSWIRGILRPTPRWGQSTRSGGNTEWRCGPTGRP